MGSRLLGSCVFVSLTIQNMQIHNFVETNLGRCGRGCLAGVFLFFAGALGVGDPKQFTRLTSDLYQHQRPGSKHWEHLERLRLVRVILRGNISGIISGRIFLETNYLLIQTLGIQHFW